MAQAGAVGRGLSLSATASDGNPGPLASLRLSRAAAAVRSRTAHFSQVTGDTASCAGLSPVPVPGDHVGDPGLPGPAPCRALPRTPGPHFPRASLESAGSGPPLFQKL